MKHALSFGRSVRLSSGLHHARRAAGDGFYQFNGLALAAVEARQRSGRIGVLDLDAHAGDGTFHILGEDPRVRLADARANSFDRWRPDDAQRRFYVEVREPGRYPDARKPALAMLNRIEFLNYNAGRDAYEKAGGMSGLKMDIVVQREQRVVRWVRARGIPHAFALAGGYRWGGLCLAQDAALDLEPERALAA